MIIDAHQHFWYKDVFNYPWLTPDLGCLYDTFRPSDLEPYLNRNEVEKTVVVQAMSSFEESKFLLSLAAENAFIGGVVAWVDLTKPDVGSDLDELLKNQKFKGVRHQAEDDPNREWILQDSVIHGLQELAKRGLAFDALLKKDQLWQLKTVVEKVPQLRIVLDHSAKPDIANDRFDDWAPLLKEVSELPIKCKLSGMLTEDDHEKWTVDHIRPYSDFVLSCFGPERVMIGSDWPVSTMAADYDTSIKALRELLKQLTPSEFERVTYLNAKEFYKL